MAGAVLSLRGPRPAVQPLVDSAGSALLWNGELFGGGVSVPLGESDSEHLLRALGHAAAAGRVPQRMQSHSVCGLPQHICSRTATVSKPMVRIVLE